LINDILDLSKIEAGKFVLEEAPLTIDSLMGNVHSILSERARDKGLLLTVECAAFPDNLLGDPTRLQQAVLNYATNAIKFTETGSVTLRAILQEDSIESVVVRFEVQDSGIGIASEALLRLFHTFEQADSSMTRKYGGTGLGLVITRRLAELMNGEAGAVSSPGVGSTFWFTVRLKKNEHEAGIAMAVTADAEQRVRTRYQGRRILLVDDEQMNLFVAQYLLESAGLLVDTAADGEQAVHMASKNGYALIIMDMQMPRLNGLEATKQIRPLPGYRDIPILAMTANAFADDKARCFAAGMNDFLVKPIDPERIFSTVLAWLEQPAPSAPH